MSVPFLSIIIPYYNIDIILLKRCIDSILCQNLDKEIYEIIIVDDGSTIFIQHIISEYVLKINLVYQLQKNQGLGGARNTGLNLSKGKYILFVDPDDYLYSNTLCSLINILKQTEVDLINFKFKTCHKLEIEPINNNENPTLSISNGTDYMLKYNLFGSAWLYIFKKEIAELHKLRFVPGIFHEDEEFTTKLYYFTKNIAESSLITYAYYQRQDSIVRKKDKKHLDKRFNDFKGVIIRLRQFIDDNSNKTSELAYNAYMKKLNLLVCDYITCMVRNVLPYKEINQRLIELQKYKLYPLEKQEYSFKYKIFRILANSKLGIYSLYAIDLFRKKIK